jgi:hypothetical protein
MHVIRSVYGVQRLLKEDHAFYHRARECGYWIEAVEGVKTWHAGVEGCYRRGSES